jgi:excisionase family DNA binding protein
LGVSPGTVRRWSDSGRLRAYTTPGGHRRFSRQVIQALLPADRRARPSLLSAGLTPNRIARRYRRASRTVSSQLPWVLALTDAQRALFRERGRVLAAGLLQFLDSEHEDEPRIDLAAATGHAAEYGRVAASLGLSLNQTVEGFLRFRAPFHHELAVAARQRGFDATETTELLEAAEAAMDTLLLATLHGHASSLEDSRRTRRGRTPSEDGTKGASS